MIICAAMKVEGKQYEPDGVVIVPCFRHGHGYRILHNLIGDTSYKGRVTEGFIDHTGAFHDRKDAYDHALRCGQLSESTRYLKDERNEHELYSEDLY